jgi:hypothetical protein
MACRFAVPLVLNKLAGNLIELGVIGLPLADDSMRSMLVDCVRPEDRRGLHIVIIGVGVPPEGATKLESQILASLQATRVGVGQGEFTTPAFTRGKVHGILTGAKIKRGHVLDRLAQARSAVESKAMGKSVVLVYYQGGEIIENRDRFILTLAPPGSQDLSDSERLRAESLDSADLERFVASTHGAHLLLLDVARDPRPDSAQPGGSVLGSHAAVLRYAWLQHSTAPPAAQLITSLPAALQPKREAKPGTSDSVLLRDLDHRLAEQFVQQNGRFVSKVQDFRNSLIYEGQVPAALADLLLTTPVK